MVVAGPVSWNQLVFLDALPEARPHTVFAQEAYHAVGGTSAGKALNLRDLGAGVTLSTVAGADEEADLVLGTLEAAGVDVVARAGQGGTERHLNLMTRRGERVSVYLGVPALDAQEAAAVPTAVLAALDAADAVVVDLADHARGVLAEATRRGLPVWCDLHDYDGTPPGESTRGSFHHDFVTAATYVFLSEDRVGDPGPFMHERIAAGARLVVCTRGARGAVALDASGRWHEVPAEHVEQVVDTNGAGDAFFSGFLMSYLGAERAGEEPDVAEALRSGARQAARVVASRTLAP